MSTRLRFGLIGCGKFARNFSAYLLEAADLVAICDVDPGNCAALAEARKIEVPAFTDYVQLLDKVRPDCINITTTNDSHADIAVAALERGIHVFCEKPMARTVPECWRMVQASRKTGAKLSIGHKRRLRPAWERMIELTRGDASPLGDPMAITVNSYCDQRPYRYFDTWWADPNRSGGFFHLHGVHVIDWFRAMCGNITQVIAVNGPQHDPRYGFADIIHATFTFESGAVASLTSSLSFPIHQFRESEGPSGECRRGGFKLVPSLEHIDLHWRRLDDEQTHHERFGDLGFTTAFRREITEFIEWVSTDQEPTLTWQQGLRCVEAMEASYRSAATGGNPVKLPLYPELELETP